MKPHLSFWYAPVMIGLSIVALGKTTSYVSIFVCTSLQYVEKSDHDVSGNSRCASQMNVRTQIPFYFSIGLGLSVFMAISGLAPKPLAVNYLRLCTY